MSVLLGQTAAMKLFATARGKRAARLDAVAALGLGLDHIPGTDIDRMTYPHTQSPVGMYGELRSVLVRGVVAYHPSPEPPTVQGGPPTDYYKRVYVPGMLSWSDHRRATRAEYRAYLTTIHPKVDAALKAARQGGGVE